jgi:plasmid stability protein
MNLSIKNVPDEVVERLRRRAARRRRSLQGELLAIIEEAVRSEQELTPSSCWRRCAASASARPPSRPASFGLTVTGAKVVDASALAALLFAEPEAETSPSDWKERDWLRPLSSTSNPPMYA